MALLLRHPKQQSFQFQEGFTPWPPTSGWRPSWIYNKKLSYRWETVRRESMPSIDEMDVEMTT